MQSNLEKEKQLLNACKADKEKFADLYNYFLPDMYRFAYSLANNLHDAEDLVSQAFTEFYKKLDSFVWQGVSIKYWLFRTVRNLWYTHARRPELTGYSDDILNDRDMEISFVEKIITEDLLQQV